MPNKRLNLRKSKFLKKPIFPKSSNSIISSSLYSGVESAQRAIQKPGSPFSIHSNELKRIGERFVVFIPENLRPSIQYHPWESKYKQIFIRENIKKSMTKDPYTPKTRLIAYAKESIVTEEECCPVLITAAAVHIEQPILLGEAKPFLPNIVRCARANEMKSPEQLAPQISPRKSSISQLQVETKTSLPMLGTNNSTDIAPNLPTNGRLLKRTKIRHNGSLARRTPRTSIMETIHETRTSLTVCG